jgi:hypothetical protein
MFLAKQKVMKKIFLFFIIILILRSPLFAQVGINSDGSFPDSSAMLDVKSVSQGVLIPRMTFEQRNALLDPVEGLMVYCTNCKPDGTGVLSIHQSGKWQNYSWNCDVPFSPVEGVHVPEVTQITWNWSAVPIALGYKWNTVNNLTTAIDLGTNTTTTETGLTHLTLYTRYVWAYNACGYSTPLTMIQMTLSFTCSDSLSIEHLAGNVAPVNKTVIYETVTNIPGVPSKCWITSNLGADHQATAVNDATEASAGWYWQFNKKQGFKVSGSNERTPNTTWITGINESSDWVAANDPCALLIGGNWRIPTITEWSNLMTGGNWINWNGPWTSALSLHAAGHLGLNDGWLYNRGGTGNYWSSSQGYLTHAFSLGFSSSSCSMFYDPKTYGYTVRCILD